MASWTPQRPGTGQVIGGLALGVTTFGYLLIGLVLTERFVIPVSGCQELDCLLWFGLPVATVPFAVAGLVVVLRLRRPGLTAVIFLAGLIGLVRANTLSRNDLPVTVLLMGAVGMLAATVAGSLPAGRRRYPE
jgi:hypothetical protein